MPSLKVEELLKAFQEGDVEELWKPVPEFPEYFVSNMGRFFHDTTFRFITPTPTQWGHLKISFTPERCTRSAALIVAEVFVEPYDELSDCVIVKNGDLWNIKASNLAWRPRQFAWRYARQFKKRQPLHYRNLPVRNVDTKADYECIIEAGITEGVMFADIWESTYTGRRPYPFHHKYRIVE